MRMRISLLALSISLIGLAADWPAFRGPARDAISHETGLLKDWPAGGPKLLWQLKDIGDGYATPAVAGSRLYVMANRGLQDELVQAPSIEDGKKIWSYRLGAVR